MKFPPLRAKLAFLPAPLRVAARDTAPRTAPRPDIIGAVELTDDELLAVSGGSGRTSVAVGISQRVHQDATIAQLGGDLNIGGGNGATSVSGNTSFAEAFSASISQTATNTNNGSVSAVVSASS